MDQIHGRSSMVQLTRAEQLTSNLVFGKTVTVLVVDRDRCGRIVGEVFLDPRRSLNRELIGAGWA